MDSGRLMMEGAEASPEPGKVLPRLGGGPIRIHRKTSRGGEHHSIWPGRISQNKWGSGEVGGWGRGHLDALKGQHSPYFAKPMPGNGPGASGRLGSQRTEMPE